MNATHITDLIRDLVEGIRTKHFQRATERFDTLDLKSRNQLVTDLDLQVEKELVSGLGDILPAADFLTEEKTVVQNDQKAFRWIIDPIDGTTNFVHGVPVFAISIGLEDSEGMLIGVVYELNSREFFSAIRGQGATLNGNSIRVSDRPGLEDSLIATGFPYYDYSYTPEYLKVLEEFMRRTRGVRRLGSAAVDLAYVACGRFDAFYEYGLSPWDVAAGSLLVQEAGGQVSEFSGGNKAVFGKSIIASQKNVHAEVLHIIQKFFAGKQILDL